MKFGPRLLAYCAGYRSFRRLGFPKLLPINITASLTFRCNSKCRTCNIWKKKTGNELSAEEFDKIFKSLGRTPVWFTMSGGEPFLRKDIVDICESAAGCNPEVINIPSNGLLTKVIEKRVEEILERCKDVNLVVNLSLDGIGKKHDEIRGIAGNFKKFMETYSALDGLRKEFDNFTLGVHTVISKLNFNDIPELNEFVKKELKPDSYISEIAEERVELDSIGRKITPTVGEYSNAIKTFQNEIEKTLSRSRGLKRTIRLLRYEYYDLVKRVLREKRQVIPCFAGWASGQIDPLGNVWPCCIKAENVGNLREVDYDFKKIWFSNGMDATRKSIRNRECYCPMANAHYTNMLCSPKTMLSVAGRVLR